MSYEFSSVNKQRAAQGDGWLCTVPNPHPGDPMWQVVDRYRGAQVKVDGRAYKVLKVEHSGKVSLPTGQALVLLLQEVS